MFTGSVNECEIVCRRVFQKYKIATIELENESFRPFYDVLSSGVHKDNEDNFDKEMEETASIKDARSLYPESQFFNRQKVGRTFFDSAACKRGKSANSFVQFNHNNQKCYGKIQFFISFPLEGIPVCALIKFFDVVEEIGPTKNFIYRIEESTYEDLKPVEDLKKIFVCNDLYQCDIYAIPICSIFEHS